MWQKGSLRGHVKLSGSLARVLIFLATFFPEFSPERARTCSSRQPTSELKGMNSVELSHQALMENDDRVQFFGDVPM